MFLLRLLGPGVFLSFTAPAKRRVLSDVSVVCALRPKLGEDPLHGNMNNHVGRNVQVFEVNSMHLFSPEVCYTVFCKYGR